MEKTELIKRPIAQEMLTFREVFDASLNTSNPLLSEILGYIRRRSGKMMRPMLTLLVAKSFGPLSPAAYHAAATLEMLHTASLVHDDVVDESDERRGQASVNAVYDNKVAVLVGDYLLSSSLEQAALTGDAHIVARIAQLGKSLSEGEILQLSNIHTETVSEEAYFTIIRQKTAALFATCAELGAIATGATPEVAATARELGEVIGICFQIRDDIFDYYEQAAIGKPTGNDMAEGKLTLPAIYALNHAADAEMDRLASLVKSGKASPDDIARLVAFTKSAGGIDYAERVMRDYGRRGHELARTLAGDGEVGQALTEYVDYVVERNM